jgi:hypothetical protein
MNMKRKFFKNQFQSAKQIKVNSKLSRKDEGDYFEPPKFLADGIPKLEKLTEEQKRTAEAATEKGAEKAQPSLKDQQVKKAYVTPTVVING